MTSPNATFARLCNDPDAYLGQSIVVFLVASILGAVIAVPYEIIYENTGELGWTPFLANMASVLASGVVSTLVVHLAGRRLGGSQNWKQTFVTLFHVHVLLVVAAVAVGAIWVAVPPSDLQHSVLTLQQDIGLALAYYAVVVAVSAWIIVLSVKAIKVVHAFGTAKAFGLLVLSVVAAYAVILPFDLSVLLDAGP